MVRLSLGAANGADKSVRSVACAILIICTTSIPVQSQPSGVSTSGRPVIVIAPSTNQLNLSGTFSVTPLSQLPDTVVDPQASFTVDVMSVLPEWGVWISAETLHGEAGDLPPDRIWVSSSGTGGEFRSLNDQVYILSGNRGAPVASTSVSVSVLPTWLDVAGVYTGEIIIGPEDPTEQNIDDDGTQARRNEREGDSEGGDEGDCQKIGVCIQVQECIDLSVSSTETSFDKITGPGDFSVTNDIELSLSTNTPRWKVVVDTVAIRHVTQPDWVIPADRVKWKLSEGQELSPVGEGNLYAGATLLRGNSPVENLRARLSFAIEILPSDPAGDYRLELSLLGQVGE